jgi:hypothetical protein
MLIELIWFDLEKAAELEWRQAGASPERLAM